MASKIVKYSIKKSNGGVTHSSINLGNLSNNPTESEVTSKLSLLNILKSAQDQHIER